MAPNNYTLTKYSLWQSGEHDTVIEFYKAENRKTDFTVVIFPGGGYTCLAEHEGRGYAEFFAQNGISSFVVYYRVSPSCFPLPLLDARRAMRFVRANSENFGINPQKIAAMGSSAGGHLCAMLSTYTKEIEGEGIDEIDSFPFIPNYQFLCYPVILRPETGYAHEGSYFSLLGEKNIEKERAVDPSLNVTPATPPAFIWHTFDDEAVNVNNSLLYAKALKDKGVTAQVHIFPHGPHGLGLAKNDKIVSQWSLLLLKFI